ncbi:unnamed protein product, partial [Mesorhabditis spiculigera]
MEHRFAAIRVDDGHQNSYPCSTCSKKQNFDKHDITKLFICENHLQANRAAEQQAYCGNCAWQNHKKCKTKSVTLQAYRIGQVQRPILARHVQGLDDLANTAHDIIKEAAAFEEQCRGYVQNMNSNLEDIDEVERELVFFEQQGAERLEQILEELRKCKNDLQILRDSLHFEKKHQTKQPKPQTTKKNFKGRKNGHQQQVRAPSRSGKNGVPEFNAPQFFVNVANGTDFCDECSPGSHAESDNEQPGDPDEPDYGHVQHAQRVQEVTTRAASSLLLVEPDTTARVLLMPKNMREPATVIVNYRSSVDTETGSYSAGQLVLRYDPILYTSR